VSIRAVATTFCISLVGLACAGDKAVAATAGTSDAVNTDLQTSGINSSDAQFGRLKTIIVTARKRSENLENVPISMEVVQGPTVAQQNFNSMDDLTEVVPDVAVLSGSGATNGNGRSDNLFIRGVGANGDPSFEQAVAIFDDGIYYGRSRMSEATFLDLDNIQILNGPQGTFFGNNAIAGALNVVSAKPTDHLEGWGRVLYGMFGQYAAEGAISGPITDTFGARLAVTRNGDSEGWIDNVYTGQWVPRVNNEAARLTLEFHPDANLNVTYKLEGSRHATSGVAGDDPYQWNLCPPPAPYPPSFAGTCAQALALDVPMGLGGNKTTGLPNQGNNLSTVSHVLTVHYHKWDQDFTSVSGFYDYNFNSNIDVDQLPEDLYTGTAPERYHQFSEELRVASPTDWPVEYLAGVYVQTDHLDLQKEANVPYLDPLIEEIPQLSALVPYLPLAGGALISQGEVSYAGFASVTWKATQRLKLNAGLRYSRDKKNIDTSAPAGTGTGMYGGFVPLPAAVEPLGEYIFGAGPPKTTELSEPAWMPSAGIQFQIDPQTMAYATYSKGWLAGGISATVANVAQFGPESVNAYEAGVKGEWLDHRLAVNTDVFLSNYKGLQSQAELYIPFLNIYTTTTTNAADTRSQGIELDAQWLLIPGLRLSADVTYLESYYTNFPNSPPTMLQGYCATLSQTAFAATPQCGVFSYPVPAYFNATGQPTQYAPRWSGNVTARYSRFVWSGYEVSAQLSPFFTSSFNQDPNGIMPSLGNYIRLDGMLSLVTPDGGWEFDLIGKNLTNKLILTSLYSKEEPRNVAVEAMYHFGR
jgi:iron complex outermembrane recepter protein